jgi:hypothetical protein
MVSLHLENAIKEDLIKSSLCYPKSYMFHGHICGLEFHLKKSMSLDGLPLLTTKREKNIIRKNLGNPGMQLYL